MLGVKDESLDNVRLKKIHIFLGKNVRCEVQMLISSWIRFSHILFIFGLSAFHFNSNLIPSKFRLFF